MDAAAPATESALAELAAELAAYRAADGLEERHRRAIADLVKGEGRCPQPAVMKGQVSAAALTHRAARGGRRGVRADSLRPLGEGSGPPLSMSRVCRRCGADFARHTGPASRDLFVPGHLTASGFIADPASGRVLLHYHRRLGRWLQMGGHLEGEEMPAAAALRESREESGLVELVPLGHGILDLDVHEIPSSAHEPAHLHFDVRYAFAAAHPASLVRSEAESAALEWLALDEAERRMGEPGSTRALVKLALRLAAPAQT